jgi:rhodanese-related sulfurtransferase
MQNVNWAEERSVNMRVVAAVFLGMLSAGHASEELQSPGGVASDVSQNSAPAEQLCTAVGDASYVPAPNRSLPAAVTADLSCAISPDTAASLLSEQADVALIDTRMSSEFEDFRINGALNLASSYIRSKPYLKNRALILLGNGKGDRDLYQVCEELKTAGFARVYVMRGGIRAWLESGQSVIGQPPSLLDMALLTPSELFREVTFDQNILLRSTDFKPADYDLPPGTPIKVINAASVKSALMAAQKRRKNKPFAGIVLVLGDGFDRTRLEEVIDALKPNPVLVYAEPMSHYAQFQGSQNAMWVAQARGVQVPACSP